MNFGKLGQFLFLITIIRSLFVFCHGLEVDEDAAKQGKPANTNGWTKVFQCSGSGSLYKQKWLVKPQTLVANAQKQVYGFMFVNPKNTKQWAKMTKPKNFFWKNLKNGRALSYNGKQGLSTTFVNGQVSTSYNGLASHFAYRCTNNRWPKIASNIYWACGNGRNGFHVIPAGKWCKWSWRGNNRQAVVMYVKKIGQIAPPQPPPVKKIAKYSCPAGSHKTGEDNRGNCICKLCPAGFKCAGGYRAKVKCAAGTYQPQQGQAMCIRASVGYYVPEQGAMKQLPCPAGHYQMRPGATVCLRSNPGTRIIMVNGIHKPQKCPKGTYQPKPGQHKCIPTSPGYFAGHPGCFAQRPCRPGTYQPKKGAWKCVPASAGYYVPGARSKMQYKCHVGTYQPKMGRRRCKMARPGFFVPRMGAKKEQKCPPKFYQHCYGQVACIACPSKVHSKYLPKNAQKQCGL